MNRKEKIFLASLALISSILVFVTILYFRIDFDQIKLRNICDKNMEYLMNKKYEDFYENTDKIKSFEEIYNNLNYINKDLGDIQSYKYIGSYKTSNTKEKFIVYSINFSKCANEDIKYIIMLKNDNKQWYISQYNIQYDNDNIDPQLKKSINYINSNFDDDSEEMAQINKMVIEFIQAYTDKEYEYIYSLLSDEILQKGSKEEFFKYMQQQNQTYGDISNIKLNNYKRSKDKLEYKLDYSDDEKNIYVTFWIRFNQNVKLSGINFSSETWGD